MSAIRSFLQTSPNTLWMIIEQILRFISNFSVAIAITRNFTVDEWGIYSYIFSIFFLILSLSKMGMDTVAINEMSKSKNLSNLMGTTSKLMFLISSLCYLLVALFAIFIEKDQTIQSGILLISLSIFFVPFYVIDYFYQSEVKAFISSSLKSIVQIFIVLFRIFIAIFYQDLVLIFLTFILEYLLISILLFSALSFTNSNLNKFVYSFDFSLAKKLIHISWPIVLSISLTFLLTRFDQFMIRYFLGFEELGYYSAAHKIYESWLTFPIIFSLSILPVLTKEREKNKDSYKILFVNFLKIGLYLSILLSILISIFSAEIITLVFGHEYIKSSNVLIVLFWASIFSCMSSFSDRYFLIEGKQKKILQRASIALTLNIFLNLIFIPNYGIIGASLATLISLIFARFLFDLLDPDTKELFNFKIKALLFK